MACSETAHDLGSPSSRRSSPRVTQSDSQTGRSDRGLVPRLPLERQVGRVPPAERRRRAKPALHHLPEDTTVARQRTTHPSRERKRPVQHPELALGALTGGAGLSTLIQSPLGGRVTSSWPCSPSSHKTCPPKMVGMPPAGDHLPGHLDCPFDLAARARTRQIRSWISL